jgi:hypothetical protein
MMKVVRQRQEITRKIEKMVKNLINKVWKKGVEDEGGKAEVGVDKEDKEDGEKNQIPKVWQKGVDDEGGEEAEAGDDKEDRYIRMVKNIYLKPGKRG